MTATNETAASETNADKGKSDLFSDLLSADELDASTCKHGINNDTLCSQCYEDAEIEDIEHNAKILGR
jgi:hypothetical protein